MRNAQEGFRHGIIQLTEAAVRIEHAGKLENRMSAAERIHIDQQAFPILEHDVLDVVIAMHHMHILRHGRNQIM